MTWLSTIQHQLTTAFKKDDLQKIRITVFFSESSLLSPHQKVKHEGLLSKALPGRESLLSGENPFICDAASRLGDESHNWLGL